MKRASAVRLCVGASAGGHTNQLLRLLDAAEDWVVEPEVYITTSEAIEQRFEKLGRVYNLGECNRHHPLKVALVAVKSLAFAIKERPDVIVTTGSMPIAIACLWCKLFGAKVVWIDSIANIEKLSMSGSMMRRFADLFLVQWPELCEKYPGAEYAGQIV